MSKASPVAVMVAKILKLPAPMHKTALTMLVRKSIKFAGTAKLDILEMSEQKVHIKIVNRKIVQNHIGGIHACAMALLAETATGFVAGMNIPGDRLPLLKTMKINYVKRATGNLEAIANLNPKQIDFIKNNEKGELIVPVTITDDEGKSPIEAEMTWAWIPKKRKS